MNKYIIYVSSVRKREAFEEKENKDVFSTYYMLIFSHDTSSNSYNILLVRGYFHCINKGIETQGCYFVLFKITEVVSGETRI